MNHTNPDFQKIQKLSNETLIDVAENLMYFAPEVSRLLSGGNSSVITWFKAYLSSEEFAGLQPKEKEQSFTDYEKLKALLGIIDDFAEKNQAENLGTL